MSGDSLIPYDEVVQDALRGVIPRVLGPIAKSGLPGAHHFYIAFKTGYAGVNIPSWLREKYPDEMTIVIQNRYWDLKVTDAHFEIGLSFNQRPEKLHIPFAAVVSFADPSVNFGLQFLPATTPGEEDSQDSDQDGPPDDEPPAPPKGGDGNVVSLDRFRKKP
jgi:uncharacterized protein